MPQGWVKAHPLFIHNLTDSFLRLTQLMNSSHFCSGIVILEPSGWHHKLYHFGTVHKPLPPLIWFMKLLKRISESKLYVKT
jgi:hypothetical protein